MVTFLFVNQSRNPRYLDFGSILPLKRLRCPAARAAGQHCRAAHAGYVKYDATEPFHATTATAVVKFMDALIPIPAFTTIV
jgi:hypothetical protein